MGWVAGCTHTEHALEREQEREQEEEQIAIADCYDISHNISKNLNFQTFRCLLLGTRVLSFECSSLIRDCRNERPFIIIVI